MDKPDTHRYIKQSKLGEGTFGQAVLVKDLHENNFKVLKKISIRGLRPEQVVNVTKEALNLGILDHAHIIKYCDSFADPFYFYIVTEFCEDGDLAKRLSDNHKKNIKLSMEQIVTWLGQLVSAIDYLHNSKNIIHRDIKTQNIFIKEESLKFGDFGLARTVTSFANTFAGTPIYMAPEILHYKPYTKSADVWSLGIVMYEMLMYQVPFKSPAEILANEMPPIADYIDQIQLLCKNLLEKDPNKRISVKDIKAELHNLMHTHDTNGVCIEIKRVETSTNDLQSLVSSLTHENDRLMRSQSIEREELKERNKKLEEENKKLSEKTQHLLKIIDYEILSYKDKHKQLEVKNKDLEVSLVKQKDLNELLQREINTLRDKIKDLENGTKRFREPLFTRTAYKRAESVDILNCSSKENTSKTQDLSMTQLIDKLDSALIKSDKRFDEKILKEKTNVIPIEKKLIKPRSYSLRKDTQKVEDAKCQVMGEWTPLKLRIKSKVYKTIELNHETWDVCPLNDTLIVVCWETLLVVDKTFKIMNKITKINEMSFQSYSVTTNGSNRVYISDWAHDRILMTDASFNYIKCSQTSSPYGIAFNGNFLYVCEPESKRIVKFDSDLNQICAYTLNDKPWQIKILSEHNIACVKHQNLSIRFYNLDNFFMIHKVEGHGGNICEFKRENFIEHSAENKKIYLYDRHGQKCDEIDTCGYGRLIPQDMYYGICVFNDCLLLTTQASNRLVVI